MLCIVYCFFFFWFRTDPPPVPVMISSFAVYSQLGWKGTPWVARPASGHRQCYFSNIPSPWGINIQSMQITWNITDEALPPSGNVVACKVLRFFSGGSCSGSNIAALGPGTGVISRERFEFNNTA